ncbi:MULTISPECIES: flagellar basal body rod protein FlgB [Pseudomonas]|uniref:Flagellar basal body rod protein FlgB n=5 Tax=Pseudomonas fluorescens group TaxID=136843 RepID=A0AAW5ACA5_9PSED|nr:MULTISPECIES: flagellar basal body rod protein FlgB [Pseudomonas]MBI6568043.1 flagellar basal body rod protein FlgB [Pseudomonas synxantha]SBW85098.1 flagellar basal body rod protein FlgB [Pseudomonas veronii 1YdBTEX2]KAA0943651.1 flagellar basal body rod protein FlgB [Pseudomonas sp. ANT_H4]KAA0946153.1 flagellar basal body rod protein FlgB [Pseudomonas sp. ANT_H14]KAA0973874.1 flagellar basal body rod protein FlgB [Pseudomonas sp. ANT_H12B]
MSINFEKAVGSAERALIYRSQRAEVLSNNIANADTPNFKARDLDFPALLASQSKRMTDAQFSLQTTNLKHIAGNGSAAEIDERALLYRIPNQPSLDQNTVDQQVELAKYTENEIHFEAAFTRLNGSFKGLIKALRGE